MRERHTDDRAGAPFLADRGTIEEVFDSGESGAIEVAATAIGAEADDGEDANGNVDGEPKKGVTGVEFGLCGGLALLPEAHA